MCVCKHIDNVYKSDQNLTCSSVLDNTVILVQILRTLI